MLVRVRCAQGNFRFEVNPQDPLFSLAVQIAEKVSTHPNNVIIGRDPKAEQPLPLNERIETFKFNQGELLFARVNSSEVASDSSQDLLPREDTVDVELSKLKGTIHRKREKDNTMKISELPIEPYDPSYLEEKKIKHMSFHAYIRKLQNEQKNSGMTAHTYLLVDEVEETRKKTKRTSNTKLALKDLPPPIILQRQTFRLTDFVEFETSDMVDIFLQSWRKTGNQRFGYLYGRYEKHEDVPLGIKAVVSVIYEPPQNGMRDGLELAPEDPKENIVNSIAGAFGLVKVGMIYTDLIDDGKGKGKVAYKRNADTFFLSSPEIIFSSMLQNAYPSMTRYTSTKKFGSKFVTVVISGDQEGNVSLSAYQVSNQAMAMVASNCIQATTEPSLMSVCPTTDEIIVPEVMYRSLNEFNTTVQQKANPTFPVDHLIVNVGHGFPVQPKPLFLCNFPLIENRNEPKDYAEFKRHLSNGQLLKQLSNFHLLLFILEMDVFDLSHLEVLVQAVRTQDQNLLDKVIQTDSWKNMTTIVNELIQKNAPSSGSRTAAPVSALSKSQAKVNYAQQLALLKDMGFINEDYNISLLIQFGGRIEDVVNKLTRS